MSCLDRIRAELGSALRAGRFTKSVDVLIKEAGDINITESHSEPSVQLVFDCFQISLISVDWSLQSAQTFSRTLGPLELTCFGIGCIIGAGVYVLTGQVAATTTGPSIVLSMIIAALGSSLSGLCYAELASMFPVAGSAYAYTYAAIGEFWAWMIGWDLVLEYALAVSLVAIGWSQYFVTFLSEVVGFTCVYLILYFSLLLVDSHH
jgi:L-asparagine transporter-like permease